MGERDTEAGAKIAKNKGRRSNPEVGREQFQ